jgi:Domain of unknown function (DUF5658)
MKRLASSSVAVPTYVRRRSLLGERRVAPYLLVLVFCSLVDWALTTDALSMGIAREGNPLMGLVTQLQPAASFAVKLAVPLLGGLVLYVLRSHRSARAGLKFLACVYVLLVLYHILGRLAVTYLGG